MTPEILDYYFPFIVLAYGLMMVVILTNPFIMKLAEERLEATLWLRFKSHLALGWVCLFVGFAWSLQNLIFG